VFAASEEIEVPVDITVWSELIDVRPYRIEYATRLGRDTTEKFALMTAPAVDGNSLSVVWESPAHPDYNAKVLKNKPELVYLPDNQKSARTDIQVEAQVVTV